MQYKYKIAGGDFANAGTVASSVKKTLRQLNIDHSISKRVVIALYEGEVNVVAHAYSGIIDVEIENGRIRILISDRGPGIPISQSYGRRIFNCISTGKRNGIRSRDGPLEHEEEQRHNEHYKHSRRRDCR